MATEGQVSKRRRRALLALGWIVLLAIPLPGLAWHSYARPLEGYLGLYGIAAYELVMRTLGFRWAR
jgi:hypothetical protein